MRKKRAANKEVALLRTLATKEAQPYSLRRLIKDLREIEENKIPTVGVAARPQHGNMYLWHANLRGPEGTPYEGGVFHLTMTFSTKYPDEPPIIRLSTPIPHPNVFGSELCLDMLEKNRKVLYQGWTSAYSVLSILIQLQSFLFETPVDYKKHRKAYTDAVRQANELVIEDIGHNGPLSPWPPFISREVENNLENYKIKKTEKELIYEELVCFHTKLSIAETHLGVGLLVSRFPRTGNIRAAEPTLDLISLKAFMKEGIRTALDNSRFTHWIPLYFGLNEAAVIYLARKSLGMICKGSTRKFEPKFIVEVFPKMMVTLVVSMMEHKEYISLKALRMFFHFYRLFVLLLDKNPELYTEIDNSLESFKNDEKSREKTGTPNLGDMLSKLTVSKKYKWSDIIGPYLEEQMDRQVLWMLKLIPELETMKDDTKLDNDRINASFKSTLVGYHLTLFYSIFIDKIVHREGRSREQLLKSADDMYGRLTQTEEELIQRYCKEINKVNDYYGYFKMLGIPFPSKKELFEAIKKSIVNSARKKYHGPAEELDPLPENNVMIEEYRKTLPYPLDSLKKEGKFPDSSDPIWKKAAVSRFPWIADYVEVQTPKEAFTPTTLASISDKMKTSGMQVSSYNQAKTTIMSNEFYKLLEMTSYPEYSPNMTWMELYLKLDFEYYMELFVYNPDFKTFYQYTELLAPYASCLCLLIGSKKGIKSGYHWLTAVLTKLPNLCDLKLYSRGVYEITLEIIKCLQKGINNFAKANGKMLKLEIDQTPTISDTKLLQTFKGLPDLRVINMNQMKITQPIASVLNKILTNFKHIQEIDLVSCGLGVEAGKEIADGLMGAKQLEIFRIAKNPELGPAMVGIVYNLAFSPKVSLIDISDISMNNNAKEVIESLYKLISISGSLKVLSMNRTYIIHMAPELFFKAIGNNRTLNVLCMDGSVISDCANLGKAFALNAKRNGSLEYVSLTGVISNNINFSNFISGFWVSDRDEEYWYGDTQEAKKMHGEQIERRFHCGVKELLLRDNGVNFGHTATSLKYVKYADLPKIIPFLYENKSLELLDLRNCNINKGDAEVLSMGIYGGYNRVNSVNSLRVLKLPRNNIRKEGTQALSTILSKEKVLIAELDISANEIGVAGGKSLATMLAINKSLKVLNAFGNSIDVDGARALKEALLVNCTLEKLDIGCNRLREKGVKELATGISLNKNSAIRTLCLRYNFVSDDGLTEFFNMAVFNNSCKLNHLYIKNNRYTEQNLTELQKNVIEKGIILHVDVFEKLKHFTQNQLERSIWISPIWDEGSEVASKIKSFFEEQVKIGIVLDVRIRKGQNIPRKSKPNIYAIVEFAHPNSVLRALKLPKKKRLLLSANSLKIYKAGTGTTVTVKSTGKKRHRVLPNVRDEID